MDVVFWVILWFLSHLRQKETMSRIVMMPSSTLPQHNNPTPKTHIVGCGDEALFLLFG